jgi:electron transfer flavoprotein beta subunit
VKICILVKAVPDAVRRVVPETGRLDRTGEGGLSTGDRYAVEAGLQLRERGALGVDEVIAITMGPANADRALRRALAMGCDRGIHICDPMLEGSDVVATGYALSQAVGYVDPGLVLLGAASSDASCGAMAAVVGEFLGVPAVTAARSVTVRDTTLIVDQISEFGHLSLGIEGPAVIAIGADANTPRYASLRETTEARSRPVEMLDCAALEIDPASVGVAGSAVVCGDWHEPEPRAAGQVFEPTSVRDAVTTILDWLDAEEIT